MGEEACLCDLILSSVPTNSSDPGRLRAPISPTSGGKRKIRGIITETGNLSCNYIYRGFSVNIYGFILGALAFAWHCLVAAIFAAMYIHGYHFECVILLLHWQASSVNGFPRQSISAIYIIRT